MAAVLGAPGGLRWWLGGFGRCLVGWWPGWLMLLLLLLLLLVLLLLLLGEVHLLLLLLLLLGCLLSR